MDTYVYVQASDGIPLMPTRRFGHVQKLLERGKARVVEHVPFVIRLRMDDTAEHPYRGKYQGQTGATGSRMYVDHRR